MAVEECVNLGHNSPVEEGGDDVQNKALLTQPRNDIRDKDEGTSTPAIEDINWTILFHSNNKYNFSPSATTRFSGYYEMDPRNVEHNRIESSYIDRLYNSSNFIIADPKAAAKAFQKKGMLGLLHIFIPPNFIDSYMLNATQELLKKKKRPEERRSNSQFPSSSLHSGSGHSNVALQLNHDEEIMEQENFFGIFVIF